MLQQRILAILVFAVSTTAYGQFENSNGNKPATTQKNEQTKLSFQAAETYRSVVKAADGKHYSVQAAAAPNPVNGPKEPYVYKNDSGVFKIPDLSSVNGGKAKYRWLDGSTHQDVLTYIAHGYVTEQQGNFIAPGTKVSVWAYRAQDSSGNHFFIYFGTDPVINAPQGKRYPLYYSYGPPGPAPTFRWLTANGTTRD